MFPFYLHMSYIITNIFLKHNASQGLSEKEEITNMDVGNIRHLHIASK